MPVLAIKTNQSLDVDQRAVLVTALSGVVAQLLGKPERYVMIALETGVTMSFGGSAEPCLYAELKSLGMPAQACADYSAQLCRVLAERLDLPEERIYIEFSAPERRMFGWNGGTFG